MKLEEAGYVAVEKKFVLRKPQTLYRMTEAGRAALTRVRAGAEAIAGGNDRRLTARATPVNFKLRDKNLTCHEGIPRN